MEDSGGASGWTIDSWPYKRNDRDRRTGVRSGSIPARFLENQVKGTAKGGTTLSTDATLSALALSGVTLAPTFVSSTETYTATVVNSVMQTTVTATPTHSGATVAFKDGDDTALTNPVTLAVGANVIKAVVTAEDTTTMKTYMVTVTREGTTDTLVTIEAEHESIGAGLEDLLFTLTRAGDTTDALDVKVTITQAQTWLGNLGVHDVTFSANSATAELTITASNFSFTPSTTGNLTATVTGDDIDGGSDTVQIISTSGPPITISYEESDIHLRGGGNGRGDLRLGDARCGLSPGAGAVDFCPHRLFVAERYGGQPRRLRRDNLESEFPSQRFRA